ncbi:MurNAc alpha-1-phosphate uridylyltransferase [Aquabacterium commune]|uniref:MurNAc alpha-1-phosphate uridylyltransferase n=1 Tax=Aquabacterium commune TaxID=70586 RepID=A0A4R6RHQ1_9BURK|nr:nucleotidyltransferase family protein [Aquabacterium commune]TDP86021.1 MurNAc alpha-1-phosphate uridylyltransferase [Aquabacterium commune]
MSPVRPPANLPALILAAGRGERMRPLTDTCPKPLLAVRGKPLIVWHLEALARDGVRDVVINTAYLEDQFEPALGDGSRWGLRIRYSHEGHDHGGALETAGGIATALPLLRQADNAEHGAFWVLAGDVFVPGFQFTADAAQAFLHEPAQAHDLAHLWLVPNPEHVPTGDFALNVQGRILRKDQATAGTPTFTYATIGLYRTGMVEGVAPGHKAALRPCLDRAIDSGRLSGQVWRGAWTDVGTPQRLAALNSPA